MKNSESLDTVVKLIENSIKKDKNIIYHVFKKELIDTRKLTNIEADKILALENIRDININVLIWTYAALRQYNENLPELDEFFTELEIKESEDFLIKRYQSKFPLKFKFTRMSPKNEFKIIMPVQEICELVQNGIVTIVDNLQREQQYTMYGDKLISHVKYNDNVAREISKAVISGEYWSKDDIGLHLIENPDCEFVVDEENQEITIKNGKIALFDGNHRVNGFQYAILKNPELKMNVSVYLTIGSVEIGQQVLAQHESQQPINKKLIKSYEKSNANDIFRIFADDRKINRRYKFVDTADAEKSAIGFVIKSYFIKAISQYYDVDNMKITDQETLADWLVEFFVELYQYLESDIENFVIARKNRWTVKSGGFFVYVAISSVLYDNQDWKAALPKILDKIDFTDMSVYRNLQNKQTVRNILK